MANKTIFSNKREARVKKADTRNKAGGRAYNLTDAESLCQYVVTSTFNDVYYSSGREQLDAVKKICDNVDPVVIAKAAVYGHETGGMKDVPAYLLAVLAARGELDLLRAAFPRVIKSPKMLLNFVQIIRSGVTGRRSFGSAVKNLIREWVVSRRGNKLFLASIGYKDPSLVDVIKMVHPRPQNEEQNALFGYLLGKDHDAEMLPPLTQQFEAFKADNTNPLPDMDYRSLTNCNLTEEHWKQIALNMPWNTLRMNLNLLARHGVFSDSKVTQKIADKLSNREEVKKWNLFPYQLFTTYQNISSTLPMKVNLALQDALDIATDNVPVLGDRVAVCVDVSGSMTSPVTGYRDGSTTATRCVDVGALIASSIARTNPEATIISFATGARVVPNFNPRDSVITNAEKLVGESRFVGHGTNISAAMQVINNVRKPYDLVIFVGDSQSWIDSRLSSVNSSRLYYGGTALASEWATFKGYSKKGKLAEIVLGPYATTQMPTSDPDVMNIGGFSDAVFDVLNEFAHRDSNSRFLDVINAVEL